MCCNSSCLSAINFTGILNTMTNEFMNFFLRKIEVITIQSLLRYCCTGPVTKNTLFLLLPFLLLPLVPQPVVGFGLSNNVFPFSYLSLTLSSFSLPALEDLFLLLLSICPGSSPSSPPPQFLSEDLFRFPIVLHSLQVT